MELVRIDAETQVADDDILIFTFNLGLEPESTDVLKWGFDNDGAYLTRIERSKHAILSEKLQAGYGLIKLNNLDCVGRRHEDLLRFWADASELDTMNRRVEKVRRSIVVQLVDLYL